MAKGVETVEWCERCGRLIADGQSEYMQELQDRLDSRMAEELGAPTPAEIELACDRLREMRRPPVVHMEGLKVIVEEDAAGFQRWAVDNIRVSECLTKEEFYQVIRIGLMYRRMRTIREMEHGNAPDAE